VKQILLAHGGGGEEMGTLISELFYRHFGNPILERAEDASPIGDLKNSVITTDSFVVSPIFFSGGDIGKIAVAGSVNDIAMMGAKPKYLTCSFILEEGFSIESLERIVKSMAEEMKKSGVMIVTGDTKVVPRGKGDQIFINTTAIGEILYPNLSAHTIPESAAIVISGDIGRHGTVILAEREEMGLESDIVSDCGTLYPAIKALIDEGITLYSMRDATRGGVSAVLNEWAKASDIGIVLDEASIPIAEPVKGMCEMMGFEPLELANEGTMIIALHPADAQKAVEVLKGFQQTAQASMIGSCTKEHPSHVLLQSPWGSSRYLEPPKGELLPRIC